MNAILDDAQAGHLRHIANLARQADNDWSGMHGRGVGQEDFGGYRFQLAYMAYALALAHRHRLPAAPGLFQPLFQRLLQKMLLPDVWMYWARISRGGSVFNAHLSAGYREEWNPVGRDNIMYSAYVQSMALLHHYLFGDARYAEPGALGFRYWSYFWGGEEKRFDYDENTLNEHIYWLMVESGYLGVACEPNCNFQICNQPAILGFRLHDLLHGGDRAAEVTAAYEQAWQQFGRIGDNGHYHLMMAQDTQALRPNVMKTPWADAWCGMLMNMWNPDFVAAHYPAQVRDFLDPAADGSISVRTPPPPVVMGHTVVNDSSDFGWVAAWAAEMGDEATLTGLLLHADRHLAPRWRDGGLYYPRNDVPAAADGRRTLVSALTGNALVALARLNVPGGFRSLYGEPWSPARHAEPALVAVDPQVDVLQAVYDGDARCLHVALRGGMAPAAGAGGVTIGRLEARGPWTLHGGDGAVVATGDGSRPLNPTDAVHAGADGLVVNVPAATERFVLRFAA